MCQRFTSSLLQSKIKNQHSSILNQNEAAHLIWEPDLRIFLRTRLGLTRAEFAARLGVSAQSIVNWEARGGALNIRAASLAGLQALARE